MIVRRLGAGDEAVVERLATRDAQTALLSDDRTLFVAAFEDGQPIGFVLGYELPRRHGDATTLFVYEVEVAADRRRRGVAKAMFGELERLARERGIRTSFVLTNEANEPAMRLYESLGGKRPNHDDVLWDFEYRAR